MVRIPSPRPPGPKPHFLIGNFPLGSRDPLNVFREWARQFGDIFYYRAGWIHVYFLNHPDYIEAALVNQHLNLLKDRVIRNSRWLFGQGLLTSEGSLWLRQRRLSQPAFQRERIVSYAHTMTAYAEETVASWQDGQVLDVHSEMMRLTVRIVARVLFDVDMNDVTDKVANALNVLMQNSTGRRMILPPVVRYLPLPVMTRVRRAARNLDEVVYDIIRKQRASGRESGDLLSLFLRAVDEDGSRMSDRQVRDEATTFLLAGHETTAFSLSWIWYLLSEYPEAEQKLHAELRSVLGGRLPQADDLARLCYTEKVVKEAMRLYPPAWGVARTVAKEFEIGGYRIPAGADLVASQWVVHHDPRYYRDPEKFDPDRWSADNMRRLPKFAYFPFGAGPRACIGAGFATMEAILLLAAIAQRFQLRLVPGHPVVPIPSITLRPKHGMRMIVYHRG
jgi:cytochrome P450